MAKPSVDELVGCQTQTRIPGSVPPLTPRNCCAKSSQRDPSNVLSLAAVVTTVTTFQRSELLGYFS